MDRLGKLLYLWRMRLPEVKINLPPQIYRCEAGWSWSPPPLTDHDLWYVLDGVGQLELDGVMYPVGPHTCFVFQPGAQIKARHDPRHRLRVFAVHFDCREFELPVRGVTVRDAVFFAALARRCEASYRSGTARSREQSAAIVAQMLLHLCAEAEEPVTVAEDLRISEAVELVREDPGHRWTVTELAQRAGLSRSQFARRFAAATGLAPEPFLIQARIERAKQLLRETEMSIGQIADSLGYRDVFYFSRQYRQVTGQTASAFRK
ncbi:MAG: HTH-type transcriptional activator RhaR [Verrucomicrobiae bacterium]|nr:HTH-type transcriptional activator RhaR [Verrucomicrobiae bacterium]